MSRHDWTAEGRAFAADDADGGRILTPLPTLDECPAALPDFADQLHRRVAMQAAAREILRLAEENAEHRRTFRRLADYLSGIEASDAETVTASVLGDLVVNAVEGLTEEVERLKAEQTGAISAAVLANVSEALRLEDDRIRRELLAFIKESGRPEELSDYTIVEADERDKDSEFNLLAALDRIVPGEGRAAGAFEIGQQGYEDGVEEERARIAAGIRAWLDAKRANLWNKNSRNLALWEKDLLSALKELGVA